MEFVIRIFENIQSINHPLAIHLITKCDLLMFLATLLQVLGLLMFIATLLQVLDLLMFLATLQVLVKLG